MSKRATYTINKSMRKTKGSNSIEIKAEPLVHTIDDAELGKGPAEAIRDYVAAQIESIKDRASASTIAKRRRAGRLGTKLWNDTGALLKGLVVGKSGDSYQTRVTGDRLTGDTAKLAGELLAKIDISGPDLLRDKGVREAIAAGPGLMIRKKRR